MNVTVIYVKAGIESPFTLPDPKSIKSDGEHLMVRIGDRGEGLVSFRMERVREIYAEE